MKKKKIIAFILMLGVIFLVVSGCLPKETPAASPAGFFSGIWHGWCAPLSLVLGIFTDRRIYEVNNVGWWYDLGFYIAVISEFGALHLSRKRMKSSWR